MNLWHGVFKGMPLHACVNLYMHALIGTFMRIYVDLYGFIWIESTTKYIVDLAFPDLYNIMTKP
jgi:hypothetical protein